MIEEAWNDIIYDFEDIKLYVDERGFIPKLIMQNLMLGEDIGTQEIDDDDTWILDLEDIDFEIHHGKELFRPTNLRGKV